MKGESVTVFSLTVSPFSSSILSNCCSSAHSAIHSALSCLDVSLISSGLLMRSLTDDVVSLSDTPLASVSGWIQSQTMLQLMPVMVLQEDAHTVLALNMFGNYSKQLLAFGLQ